MAVRDLFFPLVSYPRPPAKAAIEHVLDLGQNLSRGESEKGSAIRVRISALIYEIEVETGLYFEGASIGTFVDEQNRKSAACAQTLLKQFEESAAHHDVMHRCRLEHRTMYGAITHMIEAARLHHMTVRPQPRGDDNQQNLTERLIFESGRPALIFPETSVRPLATSFASIAVAWDGSRPATRAVADAMPFLRRAKSVRAFTATDDKPLSSEQAQQFIDFLADHGVSAVHEDVKKTEDHSIGSFMESYVASRGIDLLVMGAYGHSRLREFILGGATQSVLVNPPCWTFLSH
jgi:nucleotide-binding universal stress UspA family protein